MPWFKTEKEAEDNLTSKRQALSNAKVVYDQKHSKMSELNRDYMKAKLTHTLTPSRFYDMNVAANEKKQITQRTYSNYIRKSIVPSEKAYKAAQTDVKIAEYALKQARKSTKNPADTERYKNNLEQYEKTQKDHLQKEEAKIDKNYQDYALNESSSNASANSDTNSFSKIKMS